MVPNYVSIRNSRTRGRVLTSELHTVIYGFRSVFIASVRLALLYELLWDEYVLAAHGMIKWLQKGPRVTEYSLLEELL